MLRRFAIQWAQEGALRGAELLAEDCVDLRLVEALAAILRDRRRRVLLAAESPGVPHHDGPGRFEQRLSIQHRAGLDDELVLRHHDQLPLDDEEVDRDVQRSLAAPHQPRIEQNDPLTGDGLSRRREQADRQSKDDGQ